MAKDRSDWTLRKFRSHAEADAAEIERRRAMTPQERLDEALNLSLHTRQTPMAIHQDLKELLSLLNAHDVDYVIIGGHAVAFHGYPRFTKDLDIYLRPTFENGKKIVAVLRAFGFGSLKIEANDFANEDTVLQLGRPPNRVDLTTMADGIRYDNIFPNAVDGNIDGIIVHMIGLEDLLKNKQAAGRPQDLADAAALRDLHMVKE